MKIMAYAIALALAALLQTAGAEPYPSKPVRLVVGAGVNSTSGTAARVIADPLSAMWKQRVMVENRPEGGGVPATALVAKATPDGYTLLLCSLASHGYSRVLWNTLPYDPLNDFAPVSRIGGVPNGLVVHPSLPVTSVKGFIAFANANPGELTYSGRTGSSPQITMEWFRSVTRTKVTYVPWMRGHPTAGEVVAGRVMVAFQNVPEFLALVREGKLRALAVTSTKRTPQLPGTPTLIESGLSGFEVTVWGGLCAPKGVAKPIIAKLNADVAKVLSMPEVRKRYAAQGGEIATSTPEEFADFIKAENAKWAKAVKAAGIKPM